MARRTTAMSARSQGFSIIELMVVVAIVGIFVAIGAPGLRDFVVSNRVKTAASDLHITLLFARTEAIKRNAGVSVVPVNTADWSQGWSVQVSGTTLQAQDPYSSVTFTGPAANVTYLGTGRLASAVSFTIYSAEYTQIAARCVSIDPSGRPNVRADSDHDASNGC